MSETIELYLNSKAAKIVGTNTSDCFFDINIIEVDPDETAYISLKNIVVPYSWYNVNSTNNLLKIEIDFLFVVHIIVTIPLGNYNVTTFKNELINQIKIESGFDFIITYNMKSGKYIFKFDGATSFVFKKYSSTCFELLGLSEQDHHSSSTELNSTFSVNMFTTRQLLLCSDNFILNNISSTSKQSKNIISCIPVSGNPGSIIHYQNTALHKIHHTNNLSSLHIQIRDDMNNLVNLNGIHWSATLAIHLRTSRP